jgi:D-sedoheptulose 7-phosphate isomerase
LIPACEGKIVIDVGKVIADHLEVTSQLPQLRPQIEQIAARMTSVVLSGGKVFWMGNGGSAADSQHLAAELVARFARERRALASIALTTDSSVLTAVANDYSFDAVFGRQLEAQCDSNDVVVGISTSGNSENVVSGVRTAKALGAFTVALTGQGGGRLAREAAAALIVPSNETARIQEAHILIGHIFCDWIETAVILSEKDS